MAFLHAHHFQVVSLRSAVKALQNGEPLPHRAVVLTFDDGYADCFSRVWPVLKRYNFPATLFIYPAYIGNGGAALSWAQLQQLHGSGLFDVQCHTLTHPNLSHRKNEESNDDYEARLKQELEASKAQLESRLHIRVTQLAFPYGAFNEQVLRATKAAGFEAAWTVNEAPVVSVCGDNQTLWTLPREVMNREDSLEDFAAKIESAPLAIREMTPRPNTSSQSPTEIRAVLGEDVRPDSVSMALGRESVSARYDVRTRELSYRPIKPLRAGAYPVNIVARDQNGRPLRASWEFIATKTRIETSSGSRS